MRMRVVLLALMCALVMNFAIVSNSVAATTININNKTQNSYVVFYTSVSNNILGPQWIEPYKKLTISCTGRAAFEVAIKNVKTKRNLYVGSTRTINVDHYGKYGSFELFSFPCGETFNINLK